MRKILIYFTLCLLTIIPSFALAATEKSACNPKPLEDDLIISGPDGTCFAFRPIHVRGESPFSGETFIMGDVEEDNFRMPPTKVMVGGSFFSETEEPLWVYYLGKYEISRAQYRAIMGELPVALTDKESTPEKDNLPVTNLTYFEAIQFIHKLNQWLYTNALDSLPKSGDYPGFLRLPSESEWEFAARGGIKVEKSVFESPTPYSDKLSAHEWFGGPKSSHGKMKTIGLLKANTLGLHDMLGNVQEMTSNQYQIEYYQGRSGGFVSRGGSYIMNEDKLRSAQRQEEPYYLARRNKGVVPNAKVTLGIRLAISAPILTDRDAIAELEDAWEDYRGGTSRASAEILEEGVATQTTQAATTADRSQTPAGLAMAPLGDQAEASFNDAFERIKTLQDLPEAQYSNVKWKQELAYTVNGMLEGQKSQREANAVTAKVLIGHTHVLGQEIVQHLRQYALLSERLAVNKGKDDSSRWEKRVNVLEFNITKKLERYGENFEAIDALSANIISEAFINREKETQNDINEGMNQEEVTIALNILKTVQNHYNDFAKDKRLNIDKWRKYYNEKFKK